MSLRAVSVHNIVDYDFLNIRMCLFVSVLILSMITYRRQGVLAC